MWISPLPNIKLDIPLAGHPGSFGAIRKYDIHTGVDLYCEPNQEVVAVEDGVVVNIENFTGENATPKSPWWNDTKAVFIEGESGVVLYGEIETLDNIKIGDKISKGDLIGKVIPVLKKDKGTPMTMLHIELYHINTRESVIWNLNTNKPNNLLNPSEKLLLIDDFT